MSSPLAKSNTAVPTVFLCGAGSRGGTVYGNFIRRRPDLARVVAVAEPDHERRQRLVQEHQVPPQSVFSDWREALAKDKKLSDIAIVATPDRQHLEPALACLEHGYHLLLEKPMAPSVEDCLKIVEASRKSKAYTAVCHVLRYSAYFRALRRMIVDGAVGEPITIRHLEPVNFWHFAHSFVRGNWRRDGESSPFILAKCCHDMDLLLYLLGGTKPIAVSSFGNLSHFRKENAPAGHSDRCLSCSVEADCPYSAKRFYEGHLKSESRGWPLDVLIDEYTPAALEKALSEGPYGRCVYTCDNDVVDHQVVQILFEGGLTASLVAAAFTDHRERETEILGTRGSLIGDGQQIVHTNFLTREITRHRIEAQGNHMGGDDAMLTEFFTAVAQKRPDLISTSPEVSLDSHLMALYAERSRLSGQTVRFSQ